MRTRKAQTNACDFLDARTAGRFWAKVIVTDGCWIWIGARNRRGYGAFGLRGRRIDMAHRISYQWSVGRSIGDGLYVCHHCDNPTCVRPSHLFEGTPSQNTTDCARKERLANAILTNAQVEQLRSLAILESVHTTEWIEEMARRFSVNAGTVTRAISGKSYEWVSQPSRYNRVRRRRSPKLKGLSAGAYWRAKLGAA